MLDSDLTYFLRRGYSHSAQIKDLYTLLYLCIQKYHAEQAGFYGCMLTFSVYLHEH